jgi:hypothetical protein
MGKITYCFIPSKDTQPRGHSSRKCEKFEYRIMNVEYRTLKFTSSFDIRYSVFDIKFIKLTAMTPRQNK